MSRAEHEIREAVFGKSDYPPIVHFYDHAVPDEEATTRSGRPRFKAVPYVTIKPTHPDLTVRDYRSRAVKERDMQEYAPQWQKYLDTKERIKSRNPAIDLIPGMTVAAHAELTALGLFNCQQLVEHEGDIAPYNHLKTIANRIMELADEFKDLPEEREPVQAGQDRREQQQISPNWGGFKINQAEGLQKGSQEKSLQEAGSFSLSFTV